LNRYELDIRMFGNMKKKAILMKAIVPIERITSKIYLIRNVKVMLDRDLAELYGVETKRLKEQVRRNIERFPEDFMFELTKDELENWIYSKRETKNLRQTNTSLISVRNLQFSIIENSGTTALIDNHIQRLKPMHLLLVS